MRKGLIQKRIKPFVFVLLHGDRGVMVNTPDCGSGNASSILVGHPNNMVIVTGKGSRPDCGSGMKFISNAGSNPVFHPNGGVLRKSTGYLTRS